ncbi:MAG TPA: UDP-N-acetylglucosamine 2-epimerase (non-hydrolyzing) [Allosphingosinicella sp.]|nr:UDP-N-acetylglucosamine 2-epimerase (non-hydrolyzing) [Allosphingosinicella sp.]
MAEPRRVVSIVGTRPEAIKMAPVADALAATRGIDHHVILTGQHAGLSGALRDVETELPPDRQPRTPARLRERLHGLLTPHLKRLAPQLVLVHGDTSSALAGAMAARDRGIAIGHVEAGLRSYDMRQPWPEEGNRVAIDALSELLFAPTEAAAGNLRREGRVHGAIHVTGNTGIDAVLRALARIPPEARVRDNGVPLVLVTCHRKENQGPAAEAVCRAVRMIARSLYVDVAFVLHTNPLLRAAIAPMLGRERNVRLVEPLDHHDMVALTARSTLILTDSGGLQEEGPALGKPVLVLRNVTERPEALGSASLELVGTDPTAIFTAAASLLADPERLARLSVPSFPFGDGQAAPRIAALVQRWFDARERRPFMLRPAAAAPAAARATPAPRLGVR